MSKKEPETTAPRAAAAAELEAAELVDQAQQATGVTVLDPIDQVRRDLPLPDDMYPGRSSAEDTKREELFAKQSKVIEQLLEMQQRSAQREEELLAKLHESNELAKRLMKRHEGLNELVSATFEQDNMKIRQAFYQMLIEKHDGLVTVEVFSHDDPGRNGPVKLAHNGRKYKLPRGVAVVIPVGLLEILDNARQQSYVKRVDASDNPQVEKIDILSFPFHIVANGAASANVAQ